MKIGAEMAPTDCLLVPSDRRASPLEEDDVPPAPRASWPSRRWTPTRRKPTVRGGRGWRLLSAMTPASSVQKPAASEAGISASSRRPPDALAARIAAT